MPRLSESVYRVRIEIFYHGRPDATLEIYRTDRRATGLYGPYPDFAAAKADLALTLQTLEIRRAELVTEEADKENPATLTIEDYAIERSLTTWERVYP